MQRKSARRRMGTGPLGLRSPSGRRERDSSLPPPPAQAGRWQGRAAVFSFAGRDRGCPAVPMRTSRAKNLYSQPSDAVRPGLFPPCRVKKPCNTPSIAAVFCLAGRENPLSCLHHPVMNTGSKSSSRAARGSPQAEASSSSTLRSSSSITAPSLHPLRRHPGGLPAVQLALGGQGQRRHRQDALRQQVVG